MKEFDPILKPVLFSVTGGIDYSGEGDPDTPDDPFGDDLFSPNSLSVSSPDSSIVQELDGGALVVNEDPIIAADPE